MTNFSGRSKTPQHLAVAGISATSGRCAAQVSYPAAGRCRLRSATRQASRATTAPK
jgi:hypothetical protein